MLHEFYCVGGVIKSMCLITPSQKLGVFVVGVGCFGLLFNRSHAPPTFFNTAAKSAKVYSGLAVNIIEALILWCGGIHDKRYIKYNY